MGISIPRERTNAWITPRLVGGFFIATLAAVTVVTRLPFQPAILNNFDAVNYALALEHFDMQLAQPQAPGYPLYILIGRVFNLVLQDPLQSLVWVSIIFSGLSVAAIYLAGREIFNARVGFLASLLVSTSTVFWYMGEIAAPYTIDFFASLMVGWLSYRVLTSKSNSNLLAAALAVGLAGALRLQTLFFLFPVFFFAMRYRSFRSIMGGTAIAGLVFAIFFVPAVYLSGGPALFLKSMIGVVPIFRDTDTLVRATRLQRFLLNLRTMGNYTVRSVGELLLPFTLIGYLAQKHQLRPWRNNRLIFLILWIVPAWIVYFLVWPGNLGTMQVSLPAFFLLAAAGLDWLMQRNRLLNTAGIGVVLAIFLWQAAAFVLMPEYPFGSAYRRFENFALLQSQQISYQSRLALVSQLPVDGTIVYADKFRHMQYYLPQYRTFTYPRFRHGSTQVVELMISLEDGKMEAWKDVYVSDVVPPSAKRIVLFDRPKKMAVGDGIPVEDVWLNGHSIQVITIPEGYRIVWAEEGMVLKPVSGGFLITRVSLEFHR